MLNTGAVTVLFAAGQLVVSEAVIGQDSSDIISVSVSLECHLCVVRSGVLTSLYQSEAQSWRQQVMRRCFNKQPLMFACNSLILP